MGFHRRTRASRLERRTHLHDLPALCLWRRPALPHSPGLQSPQRSAATGRTPHQAVQVLVFGVKYGNRRHSGGIRKQQMESQPRLPPSRKEALKVNAKRYFTGKPCKYGHVDDRKTSNGRCVECDRLDSLKRSKDGNPYYWENRDKILTQRKKSNRSEKYNQNRKDALALNPLMAENRRAVTSE